MNVASVQYRSVATPALTFKEREALRLMGLGLTAQQAAHQLGVCRNTFLQRKRRAYLKLDCDNKMDALRALGWLVVPE